MLAKIIEKVKEWQAELVLALATLLIAFLSFQAGKIQALNQLDSTAPTVLEASLLKDLPVTETGTPAVNFPVVGSKNSDKYHFLWCSGAGKISAKNKITFADEAKAQAAGYTLASNCQR
jgi:hypothetical protein